LRGARLRHSSHRRAPGDLLYSLSMTKNMLFIQDDAAAAANTGAMLRHSMSP
jgi:hypothetical protein